MHLKFVEKQTRGSVPKLLTNGHNFTDAEIQLDNQF